MARKPRIFLRNTAAYVYVQAINDELLFKESLDYEMMSEFIKKNSKIHEIEILNSTLLKSSFYLIIKSENTLNISSFMQALGRNYVGYFNKEYERKGSLWLSRYKTSLIDEKEYLEEVKTYLNYLRESNVERIDFDASDSFIYIQECFIKQNIIASETFKKDLENKLGTSFNKKRGRPKVIRNKMYKKLVKLNKNDHKDLKISQVKNLDFARNNSSFPVLVSEMVKFNLLFPLVFTLDENPQIIALTTLNNINVSINNDGLFVGNYIPAYYSKYPFTFIALKDKPDQKVVAIDEEADNLSYELGNDLFDEDMQQTTLLKDAISYLSSYEEQAIKTFSLTKIIADANILEEREVSIGEGDEKEILIK